MAKGGGGGGGKNANQASGSASKTDAEKTKTEPPAIEVRNGNLVALHIHAKPGAKQSAVTDVGQHEIGVAIAAPPRDGAANDELRRFIAETLGIRQTAVDFDRGAKSRTKVLLVDCSSKSLTPTDVEAKLRAAASE